MSNIAAIYARYSTDNQRDTSIDDQIRRCREMALRHGLTVDDDLIFTDMALSGSAKHVELREGYKQLKAAWDAGKFDFLLVDDSKRLDRDPLEHVNMQLRLEKNLRVVLITGDGIDTRNPHWQLHFGLQALVGQQTIREAQYLVTRGMVGQLERGFMIAAPAFGYKLKREYDGAMTHIGSHWLIEEAAAEIVRKVFRMRASGQSMHQIARWLNDEGIPLSRQPRDGNEPMWRPARVKNMLRNPIYRGEFVWNGSSRIKTLAKKTGRSLDVRIFARPQLQLVSDELWYKCNTGVVSRSGYGGGKHAFAGLVTCGCCGKTLVVSSQSRCRSLYCASCTTSNQMVSGKKQSSTIAVAGVEVLLKTALRGYLSPEFINAFKEKLRRRLTAGHDAELAAIQRELSQAKMAQDRLSRLIVGAAGDDDILEKRYRETRERVGEIESRLKVIQSTSGAAVRRAIQAQLQADPSRALEDIFNADLPPERLRSTLIQVLPQIVFLGKPWGRYTSVFKLRVALGVLVSELVNGPVIDTDLAEKQYKLIYHPSRRGDQEAAWAVEEL